MIRHHPWIAATACAAVATAAICYFCLSKYIPSSTTVSAAEDEVYEAVVRDMVTPNHGQANINQLIFDDAVLTGSLVGADLDACKEGVRKQLRFEDNAPPFNSLADKIYRLITYGWDNGSIRADTVQDFIKKSCTEGPLSRTFHTDMPRLFINPNSVFFEIVPLNRSGLKDFRQTFPGASGIISLSRAGFDSTLHEAIVSTSFVCGNLCGTGQLYILKKKRGRWGVISKSIIWVS